MSRENDSPPSGPEGRGDAAYPPGTPPYAGPDTPTARPPAPAPGTGAGGDGDPGVPATETTLTTRIRINIPGSRPIPPVVVRQPFEGGEEPDTAGGAGIPAPAPGPAEAAAASANGQGGGDDAKPTTSDWFAPRKPKDPAPSPGAPGGTPPAGPPPAQPPVAPPAGPTGTTDGSGMQFPAFAPPAEPGAPAGTPPAGVPQAHPAPGDTGSVEVPVSESGHGFAGDDPANALPVRPTPAGGTPRAGLGGPGPAGARGPGGVPTGPTSGPATGSMPLKPATPAAGRTLRGSAAPQSPTGGMGDTAVGGIPAVPSGPDPTPAHGVPQGPGHTPAHGVPQAGPQIPGPGHTPAHGMPQTGPGPEGARYPQEAAPAPGFAPAGQPPPRAVPPPGPGPVPQPGGDGPPVPPPAPASAARSRSGSPAGRPRGDRKKLAVMAGAGVFGVLCIAYGAGLVLNNDDVPKGTTVLGVDIGGSSRDQAVAKLDAALEERTKAPIVLRVGDQEQELTPQSAGLGIDTAESVRSAMGSDYNPVSVIGSLFGGSREVDPAMVDDTDKLRAQLQEIADEAGGGKDGMIRFVNGEAVPVKGEPHEAVDVEKSMGAVQEAFDERAAGGANEPVTLPVSQQEPSVSQAEFDSAMNGFAETAMSGYVAVQAGDRYIEFSPERSISEFLTMEATPDGKLAPKFDLEKLEALYGSTFDGLLVQRGDGSKTEITPNDVASAMMGPLRETDPEKRVGVIDTA
ncbi:hypothetical protein O7599_12590 [Streptomyces sp. WMMC500]|uniref:hypothetical protein n=1 Tax=Streptomyces sp. WMMC500 TaxID=3015154 RepID=UPI00248B22E1|nr:hypothetical protein [Streptomyces sp. WMMC500]WBB63308.1 hypothetical protein O7599_12590 [Streptomyces sp. WMMC500]